MRKFSVASLCCTRFVFPIPCIYVIIIDMRLFIAITFPDQMMEALKNIQQQMRRQGVRGSFTPEENLHLTLAFIGEYPDPDPVLDVIHSLPVKPFKLSLDGVGNFGSLWWAGLEKSEPLDACVKSLRHSLADAGIPFDRKKFSPHITLIRKADYIFPPQIQVPKAAMTVEHVCLYRSDRGRHGMIYTEIQ